MIPWLALNIERLALTSALGICLTVSPVVAETLSGQLPSLLSKHERIIAAKEDMIASKHALQEAVGAWLPTLDATLNLGTENQTKPSADDGLRLIPCWGPLTNDSVNDIWHCESGLHLPTEHALRLLIQKESD